MEKIKRVLAFVWNWLFHPDRGMGGTVKWVALIAALFFDGCGGLFGGDSFPFALVLGYMVLNVLVGAGASLLDDFKNGRREVGTPVYCAWYERPFWHPLWFFPAVMVVIFVTFFRIGYEDETYYDREVAVAIEPAVVNLLPQLRYQILDTPDQTFNPGHQLSRRMKLGTTQVNIKVEMPMTVYPEEIFWHMVEHYEGVGYLRTSSVLATLATKVPVEEVLGLTSAEEVVAPDFAGKYEEVIKSFFFLKGINVKGTLVIREINIYPNYYNEAGEVIYQ